MNKTKWPLEVHDIVGIHDQYVVQAYKLLDRPKTKHIRSPKKRRDEIKSQHAQ
jgi:hypothetical protein